MRKVVFGFVGQMASGKGTAAAYLKETHGAVTFRFSTVLRDILDRLYLPHDRANIQRISQVLREGIDQEILSRVIVHDVEAETAPLIVIDGVRRKPDVAYLRDIDGFILVHITADMQIRFERLTKRSENPDDQTKTFEQFQRDHDAEAEIQITEIATEADETIDNNGSQESLYAQLDALVQKYAAA